MLYLTGIIATDEVNRYNERISLSALVNAYVRQWADIMPYTYNHDSTKLIGCSKLWGVYIQPRKAMITNTACIAEDSNDRNAVTRLLSGTFARNIPPEYAQLQEQLSNVIIGEYSPVLRGSVAIRNIGIVARTFPELLSQCDPDGLIDLTLLNAVLPGVYQIGDYLVYAHSYFRRSLSHLNSLNTAFLDAFERAKETAPGCTRKIKLDPDMIGLAGTQGLTREYAYWWGPQFTDDLSTIPTGLTHYENENYDSFLSPICFTECGWYIQDNIRTFECEEVTDTENIVASSEKLCGCRYVHSMLNSSTGEPRHLDGAIRAYTLEKMIIRLDTKMTDSPRDTIYTKLWRIDGCIPPTVWKELITHYYRDNHLIGEYFSGTDSRQTSISSTQPEEKASETSASHLSKYVPVNFTKDNGIHLFISCRELEDFNTYDAKICPLKDTIPSNTPHIELMTETLYKYMKRNGLKVRLPFCSKYLFCRDMNINFSTVLCRNVHIANTVMECIRALCFHWSDAEDDRLISFAVGINYSEYCIVISLCGHVDALLQCFNNGYLYLPEEPSDLAGWAERLYSFEQNHFHSSIDLKISDIVLNSGRLGIKHYPIAEKGELIPDENGICFSYEVKKETAEDIGRFGLSGTLCASVEDELCSKCNKQYSTCDCLKVIDSECCGIIRKATPCGMYWINRCSDASELDQ